MVRKKLVIFVGAGVSKNSGLPDWNELVKKYAEKLNIEFNSNEMLEIPEKFFEEFGKIKYYEILEEVFYNREKEISRNNNFKIYENLNYLTENNFEEFIENSRICIDDID